MKTNKISIKNRKIKLKDKYSRKHIGGSGSHIPPSGAPPPENPFRPERVARAERLRQGLGMSQIKIIKNDLFNQLNKLTDEQIRNLTTPMINAVKRLSSKPQTDTLDSKNQTTIEEEVDLFLGLLNDVIYPNQIYCIDEYLQKELSLKSMYGKMTSTMSRTMSAINPYADTPDMDRFNDEQMRSLKTHVNTTNNLTDTSNKFKDTLIKLLSAVETHRKTGTRI